MIMADTILPPFFQPSCDPLLFKKVQNDLTKLHRMSSMQSYL